MDALKNLPRETQILLGALLLYFIDSLLGWQSAFGFSVSEWHGFGVLVALVGVATLLWEAARAFDVKLPSGSVAPGLISVALALALLVFTVIIFLDWSQVRAWPEFAGLILSIVIGVLAFRRAKSEGIEMPNLPKASTTMGGGGGSSSSSSTVSGSADDGTTSVDPDPESV